MTELSVQTPEVGQPDSTEDPKVANAITAIRAWANGNISGSNILAHSILEEDLEIPGAWEALTLGAKVENGATQTPRVRKELGSSRLRGTVKIKAGEKLLAGETLFTIPAGLRPLGAIRAPAPNSTSFNKELLIATSGVATLPTELTAGEEISLDSITFNRT